MLSFNFAQGQKIEVTPNGIDDKLNNEKNYIGIKAENKTSIKLYTETIKYLVKKYKNPEKVIKSKIENETIILDTYKSHFIKVKNGFAKVLFDAKYRIELSFKDNKVKYEILSLTMQNKANYSLSFTGKGMSFYIFKSKDNSLKQKQAKEDIESYFNNIILDYKTFLNEKETKEDW